VVAWLVVGRPLWAVPAWAGCLGWSEAFTGGAEVMAKHKVTIRKAVKVKREMTDKQEIRTVFFARSSMRYGPPGDVRKLKSLHHERRKGKTQTTKDTKEHKGDWLRIHGCAGTGQREWEMNARKHLPRRHRDTQARRKAKTIAADKR